MFLGTEDMNTAENLYFEKTREQNKTSTGIGG